MKKFIIPLLTVAMVVSIILAGCAPTSTPEAPTPSQPVEQPPPAPPEPPPSEVSEPPVPAPPPVALPRPGEWTVQTGLGEFMLAFIVNPDSTGITEICYSLGPGFECGDVIMIVVETTVEESTPWPITGGHFTIDFVDWMMRPGEGPSVGMVIQGEFDETGTRASGTWEISSDGTPCREGTWEASAP